MGKAGRLRYPLKPHPVNIIIHLKICPKITSQEKNIKQLQKKMTVWLSTSSLSSTSWTFPRPKSSTRPLAKCNVY